MKIAVLGEIDRATAREKARGFGRHTVVFFDGDKSKSFGRGAWDAAVVLNRFSHKIWEKFLDETGGKVPTLKMSPTRASRVRTITQLRHWLRCHDQGTTMS
jgi:hypothetical protein